MPHIFSMTIFLALLRCAGGLELAGDVLTYAMNDVPHLVTWEQVRRRTQYRTEH